MNVISASLLTFFTKLYYSLRRISRVVNEFVFSTNIYVMCVEYALLVSSSVIFTVPFITASCSNYLLTNFTSKVGA